MGDTLDIIGPELRLELDRDRPNAVVIEHPTESTLRIVRMLEQAMRENDEPIIVDCHKGGFTASWGRTCVTDISLVGVIANLLQVKGSEDA